jgi:hypothetical protein
MVQRMPFDLVLTMIGVVRNGCAVGQCDPDLGDPDLAPRAMLRLASGLLRHAGNTGW